MELNKLLNQDEVETYELSYCIFLRDLFTSYHERLMQMPNTFVDLTDNIREKITEYTIINASNINLLESKIADETNNIFVMTPLDIMCLN